MTLLFAIALIVAVGALVGAVVVARRSPLGSGTSKGPRHVRDEKPRL